MTAPCMTAAASLRLLTLVLLAVLGFASQPAAANPCTDTNPPYTPYTLKIFNDTTLSNIYPVIATPTNQRTTPTNGCKAGSRFKIVKKPP